MGTFNPSYDKVDPISGSFRARLAASLASALVNGGIGPIGVSLDTAGRLIKGSAGQSGLVGVLVKNVARGPVGAWGTGLHSGTPNPNAPIGVRKGDAVDVMTAGDIVNLDTTLFPAGTKIYALANGTLSKTSATGAIQIGFTVDAGHLIVRFSAGNPAAA